MQQESYWRVLKLKNRKFFILFNYTITFMRKQRPRGVQVQVKDEKGSRSFTVHNMDKDSLFYRFLVYTEKLSMFEDVKLVCYKGDTHGSKEKTPNKG
jgi:hypothetical protein